MSSKQRKAIYKVIHKATNFKAKPPKEKHIQATLTFTYNSRSSEEVVRSLSVRKDKTNWAVVLKVLIVIHRCFKDGDDAFIELLSKRPTDIFGLSFFKRSAPPDHVITVFITKYARYLEEKVSVFKVTNYQFEKDRDCLTDFSEVSETLRMISKLQSQLNALCNCKLRVRVSDLKLIKFAYRLLLKDSFILYAKLNEVMLTLSDLFWEMDKADAGKVLSIYKLFIKETTALTNMYNNANMMFTNLPKLKEIDATIIATMEEYVTNLDDNGHKARDDDSAEDLVDQDELKTSNKFQSTLSGFGLEGSDTDDSDSSSGDDEPQNDDFLSLIMGGLGVSSNSFFQRPTHTQSPGTSHIFSPSLPPPTTTSYENKANFIRQAFDFTVSSPTNTTMTNVTNDPLDLFNLDKLNTTNISVVRSPEVITNPFDESINPFSNRILNQQTNQKQNTFVPQQQKPQQQPQVNPFAPTQTVQQTAPPKQSDPNPFLVNTNQQPKVNNQGNGNLFGQPSNNQGQGNANPFLSSSPNTQPKNEPFNPFLV